MDLRDSQPKLKIFRPGELASWDFLCVLPLPVCVLLSIIFFVSGGHRVELLKRKCGQTQFECGDIYVKSGTWQDKESLSNLIYCRQLVPQEVFGAFPSAHKRDVHKIMACFPCK